MGVVQRHARVCFRHLSPEALEDALAEAVAAAFESYVRLKARGKNPTRDFPSRMATYGVLHVWDDRHVGSPSSSQDVLSPKAQRKHGFRVQSLPQSTRTSQETLYGEVLGQRRLDAYEEILGENCCTPVDEQAAFRIDFAAWQRTLAERDRRIVHDLMLGEQTSAVAQRFGLTAGRVSQKRRDYYLDWQRFTGDALCEQVARA